MLSLRLPILVALVVVAIVGAACGSTSGVTATSAEPIGRPVDCDVGVDMADLVARPPTSIDATRSHLPTMLELHDDTMLVWDRFEIQPDHLMIDGWPRLLVPVGDARGRCDEILAAVARPDLMVFMQWTEEGYSDAYDRGGLPPWRQLIELDIEAASADSGDDAPLWLSIGTGLYGVTSVGLRHDQEALAATLAERYGPLIKLDVGNFAYPRSGTDPGATERCGTVPRGSAPSGLAVDSVTRLGGEHNGRIDVVVTNSGSSTWHVVPDRVAELVIAGGTEFVTAFAGAMTSEARGSTAIEPGESTTVTARQSTAPCGSRGGYDLPAGQYEFVIPIWAFEQPAFEGSASTWVLLPRVAITLD